MGEIKMAEIWTMGEMLCEIMRPEVGMELYEKGLFYGPYPSGAPAIFIDTVARLGHSAGIIGGVGKDDFGKCLLERLEKDGVDISHVIQTAGESTGVAFVTYFVDGSRKYIFHFSDSPATKAKAPMNAKTLGKVEYFHVMGCSLMASAEFGAEIVKTMHLMRSIGAKISFDPNIRVELLGDKKCMELVEEVMRACSVFEPGVAELLMITGEDSVETAVEKCFKNPILEVITLKNGSKGCTVYTREHVECFGVYPTVVKDATGAGDCFDGAFLCGLIEGKSTEESAKMASAAASLNTAAFGPMEGAISRETIAQKMSEKML